MSSSVGIITFPVYGNWISRKPCGWFPEGSIPRGWIGWSSTNDRLHEGTKVLTHSRRVMSWPMIQNLEAKWSKLCSSMFWSCATSWLIKKKSINTSWFQPTPRCICLNNCDLGAGNLINISMIIEVQLKISKLSQCLGNRGNTSSPLPFLAPWIQSLCTTGRHCGSLRPNKTSANGAKMKSTNRP